MRERAVADIGRTLVDPRPGDWGWIDITRDTPAVVLTRTVHGSDGEPPVHRRMMATRTIEPS